MVVTCIGYQTPPIEGVPYEENRGRFANSEGVIGERASIASAGRGAGRPGRSAPTGRTAMRWPTRSPPISAASGGRKEGRPGLDRLLESRNVDIVTFRDWQRIEAAEAARAREGNPREKFVADRGDAGRAPLDACAPSGYQMAGHGDAAPPSSARRGSA